MNSASVGSDADGAFEVSLTDKDTEQRYWSLLNPSFLGKKWLVGRRGSGGGKCEKKEVGFFFDFGVVILMIVFIWQQWK